MSSQSPASRFVPRLIAAIFCSLVFWPTSSAVAQRNLKQIPDPDPELERKSFVVADGFEVNLFASDPRIAKPIQMNFDPQGRLWVASSSTYPHIKPGQKADDRILVLEDADGDGKAEKTTVFADGLLIPTGVEPGDGGAYVANSTELLHFADTDGDGKADRKRIILSGFGTEDTHHILHTLRWGPDGLYMNQSIYIHSHIETPYGVKRLNAGGIWRFRPETLQLGVFARGWYNSWGHHFDEYGQSFATDGAGSEGINFVVPGASYPAAQKPTGRSPGALERILHGLNPGSPKYCGLEIVGGRHLPFAPGDSPGAKSTILTNDFRGNRVCRFVLSDDGSGFAARQQEDLLKTKHVAFRPVDVKMGPDGAIYIADWYNPIIQHGEVDFRDPRRDHVHGRIWRVTFKGNEPLKRPQLVNAKTADLLAALKSPEPWTRHNAKRVLKQRGAKTVLPAIPKYLDSIDPKDPLAERYRLEALWVCQSLRAPNFELLKSLTKANDPRVRAAAARVLAHWLEAYATVGIQGFVTGASGVPAKQVLPTYFERNAFSILERLVADDHPRVRLDAVRALAKTRSPAGLNITLALRALDKPMDKFLDYALWLTVRELQEEWLPRYEAARGGHAIDRNVDHLLFAAKASRSPSLVPSLLKKLSTERLTGKQQSETLAVIAAIGESRHLRQVFLAACNPKRDAAERAALLRSLAEAARRRNARPAGKLDCLAKLLSTKSLPLRLAASECAGGWRVESLRNPLTELFDDRKADPQTQAAAINALAEFGGTQNRDFLARLADRKGAPQIQRRAIIGLVQLDLPLAAKKAVAMLQSQKTGVHAGEVVAAFLSHKGGPAALVKALQGKTLPRDVALVALRTVRASGRPHSTLQAAVSQAGNVTAERRALTGEELASMVAAVENEGDASRGEKVFRRETLNCLKCHSIAGSGGKAGPDLLSIGGSAQVDYLIEALLEPNKKVKENYQTLVVVTDKGKVHTGIKVRESNTELILRDAEDREVRIPAKSIELRRNGKSLMPAGLLDQVTRAELVDLVAFLSRLGKVGKFAVGRTRVVRTWRMLADTADARHVLRRTSYQSSARENTAFLWKPVYSTVAGTLPLEDLPAMRIRRNAAAVSFVRFRLSVTTPGKVGLRFNTPAGLSMWIAAVPQAVAASTMLDLEKGTHTVTLVIDRNKLKAPLRVELTDVPGSKAKARIVGGK